MPISTNRQQRQREFNNLEMRFNAGEWDHYDLVPAKTVTECHTLDAINGVVQPDRCQHLEFRAVGTVEAALDESGAKPLILIFASAKNPGGGVANGAIAQEEEVSLCSTWYFQAKDSTGFYLTGHVDPTYTDALLYSKDSLLLKDANHYWLDEPTCVSFVASAAPNLTAIRDNSVPIKDHEIQHILTRRATAVLNLADKEGHDSVVLGAWGTGVFGIPDDWVAKAFKEAIRQSTFDGKIIFAIPDSKKLDVFKNVLETQDYIQKHNNSKRHKP